MTLEVAGPNIESLSIYALTRRDANLKALKNLSPQNRMQHEAGANLPLIYSSRFQHLAGPSRPIIGTVRDGQTHAPIPNMGVAIYAVGRESGGHAKADAQGCYRIEGLPVSGRLRALSFPLGEEPYLKATHELNLTATDLKPMTVDFNLARGIRIQGRVTDSSNGHPVPGVVTCGLLRQSVPQGRTRDWPRRPRCPDQTRRDIHAHRFAWPRCSLRAG